MEEGKKKRGKGGKGKGGGDGKNPKADPSASQSEPTLVKPTELTESAGTQGGGKQKGKQRQGSAPISREVTAPVAEPSIPQGGPPPQGPWGKKQGGEQKPPSEEPQGGPPPQGPWGKKQGGEPKPPPEESTIPQQQGPPQQGKRRGKQQGGEQQAPSGDATTRQQGGQQQQGKRRGQQGGEQKLQSADAPRQQGAVRDAAPRQQAKAGDASQQQGGQPQQQGKGGQPQQQGKGGQRGAGEGKGKAQVETIASAVEKLKLTDENKMDPNESFDAIVKLEKKQRRSGRAILIETNYLELGIEKLKSTAYHFDVEFEIGEANRKKQPPKRLLHYALNAYLAKYFPKDCCAFDGRKNLYAVKKLVDKDHSGTVEVQEDAISKPLKVDVKIQLANTINMNTIKDYMAGRDPVRPQVAIQCLDVVFRQQPSLVATQVGRSFFIPQHGNKLGTGMELWYGIFQSALLGSRPFLNVDVAHKAFPIGQPVVSLIKELLIEDRNDRAEEVLQNGLRDTYTLESFLRGLKVKYEIPNQPSSARNFKVIKVIGSAERTTFTMDDKKQMNVAQYFLTEKKYRLRYPRLPCLHVGNPDRTVYIPVELCEICPGQVTNRKLNEIQTTQMIRSSATSTWVRKNKILEAIAKVRLTESDTLTQFGVKVSTDFTKVEARILDSPNLKYARSDVKVISGVWRPGLFFNSKNLVKWAVLNLCHRTRNEKIMEFARMVQQGGRSLGMNIAEPCQAPQALRFDDNDMRCKQDLTRFFSRCSEMKMDLLFVILPGMNTTRAYAVVKSIAELDVGLLTQCIKTNTMFRMSPPTVTNILFKVNAKLNGINHILAPPRTLLNEDCIVVGADVTHPPPDAKDKFSVAAVAASCDQNASQYSFLWRIQEPKMEIITDLQDMMMELLKYYKTSTGRIPQSILFFRDGVSEGQFAQVQRIEITAIKDACKTLSISYKPKITFLVVQKRHHTRFFPTNPRDGDKNGNVPPGTCVDSIITYPNKMDFYLCSHASLQGVSRPTRYCMLLNEREMCEDEIEELTYYLCHLFQRCTRSVSYPAPTYYAHLAAFRANNYLNGITSSMAEMRQLQARLCIKENICKDRPMFFI